jgi:hypothetical protein
MLFSADDDRSGVAYQEYRCVYGEDVAAALRFLFNAMAPKDEPGLVLQGIPAMLYLDNGPVAKSATFRRVMAPCCMGGRCGRIEPYPCSGSCGADILRASEVEHSVQHVGGDRHLDRLSPVGLEA